MIVAPFFGEFGWEVAMWVPWLRWMREHEHKGTDFIVMCRTGHGELYRDFATKVTTVIEPYLTSSDCANGFVKGSRLREGDYHAYVRKTRPNTMAGRIITPLQMQFVWPTESPPKLIHAEHHVYGKQNDRQPHVIVIHARSCDKKQPDRNWSPTNWMHLLSSFKDKQVFAIGSDHDAYAPNGTKDFRGAPLKVVVDVCARAKVGIGPSSGPLHLMNACATPVVWWSGNKKDEKRYGAAWNPLALPNEQASANWHPEPEQVIECLKEQLSR